ncbi:BTAD domain-containing putative transcriptional regulator [Streptomyces sp. NPDC050617]|uniref:AfsR/SARP family transcriptional regulator n=1 Tax=Streptomyces sp. NPDC050617 TaxID=3154628 RepID=UPI003427CE44
MEFLLLGPLSVRLNAREVYVSAPRQRVVLATLLLNVNHVVSVDRIAGYVWDGSPPPSAAATIRTYVMRLRQVLGEQASARIITRAPGYLIALGEDESDLGRFTAHRHRAAAHADVGNMEDSCAELTRALAGWRDEPLVNVPSQTLRDVEGRYLQELRLQTTELRFDAELALGRHAELIPELWRLVRENPLREALVGKLMLALFRSGRQSESLALYQRTRDLLVEQLGAEPGADLREVQRRILSADDLPDERAVRGRPARQTALVTRSAPPPSARPWHSASRPKPAELPAVPPELTARDEPLEQLRRALTAAGLPTGSVGTAVVTGRGGTGKSALALHAAHALRESFPDGQLYAELGSRKRPLASGEVLNRFLAALGVPRADIPADENEREVLYRSLTAGSRLLVLLDDADSTAQIRPLVPGSGGSGLLVTSRRRLADLEGAHTVTLPPLDERESLELLGRLVGPARVEAEPQAARTVVAMCAGLPLALRIAGARQLERPHWSLGDLAQRLTDAPQLLDALRIGDLDVRPSLDAGHTELPRRSANGVDPVAVFTALGAVNAAHTSRGRVAAMLNCSEESAEDALDTLVEAHLLHPPVAGRYRLDALLQAYARERAQEYESFRHQNVFQATGTTGPRAV